MPELTIVLPEYVSKVFAALSNTGHRGYLVGGSLRDLLRGETPHDFDLTTDATPEQMKKTFRAFRTIPTGLRHGTLTVLSGGHPVEVTTHRVDGAYTDSRHPEAVRFTAKLREDLSRRDFTVNAMAWSEETGLVDLFGGQEDLAKGILRAVGEPRRRFEEDALRILRLFRFSAQLDFSIDAETLQGAIASREGLSRISAERIFGELSRTLTGKAASKGMEAMRICGCFPYVFGALSPDACALAALSAFPPDPAVRLAALFRKESPASAEALCRALHTSKEFLHTVTGGIAAMQEPLPQNDYEARRFVCRYFAIWRTVMEVRLALGEDAAYATELCARAVRDRTAVDLPRLAVNGKELQEKAGVRAEKTAQMLRYLQDAVWHDPAKNKKAILLELAIAREKESAEHE